MHEKQSVSRKMTYSVDGLSAGVGLGLAMGVFNAIPTEGASLLAAPFTMFVLGTAGFLIGLLLDHAEDCCSKPDDPHLMGQALSQAECFSQSDEEETSEEDLGSWQLPEYY